MFGNVILLEVGVTYKNGPVPAESVDKDEFDSQINIICVGIYLPMNLVDRSSYLERTSDWIDAQIGGTYIRCNVPNDGIGRELVQ